MISVNTDLAKGSRKPQRKKQTPPPKKKIPKDSILQVNKKAFCSDVKNIF